MVVAEFPIRLLPVAASGTTHLGDELSGGFGASDTQKGAVQVAQLAAVNYETPKICRRNNRLTNSVWRRQLVFCSRDLTW